ncbi:three-helix bundle dimerization domain-containing protein [Kytococcus sedentarius]|uniref:three-helix bundle dimerization domain-containing protein n=1 Tax=Kytococcus sedentarius TaxID=1276 RepID=UPI00384F78A2
MTVIGSDLHYDHALTRLSHQFAGVFSREEVAAELDRVRHEMESTATVTTHIPVLAEREVQDLLEARAGQRRGA